MIAKKNRKAKFIYISTDSVFDGQVGSYRETSEVKPLNIYAQTKVIGEQEILDTSESPYI